MAATLSVLVALCMTLSLSLVSADWDTEYDRYFSFECPNNQFLKRVKSQHDNHYEDRIWDFECHKLGSSVRAHNCAWSDFINDHDEVMFFSCPANKAMAGIQGTHSDDAEDRRFKVLCCGVKGRVLHSCELTGLQNDLDGLLDYVTPPMRVLTGMYSYHSNAAEDRRFRFSLCKSCGRGRCYY